MPVILIPSGVTVIGKVSNVRKGPLAVLVIISAPCLAAELEGSNLADAVSSTMPSLTLMGNEAFYTVDDFEGRVRATLTAQLVDPALRDHDSAVVLGLGGSLRL